MPGLVLVAVALVPAGCHIGCNIGACDAANGIGAAVRQTQEM